MYIDGRWTAGQSANIVEVIDPATEDVVGLVPEATATDASHAVEAARKAFDEGPWPWMKPRERAGSLVKMAESLESCRAELREMVVAQTGSTGPLTAAIQAGGAISVFRSSAEHAVHSINRVEPRPPTGTSTGMIGSALVREPIGVIVAITPSTTPSS